MPKPRRISTSWLKVDVADLHALGLRRSRRGIAGAIRGCRSGAIQPSASVHRGVDDQHRRCVFDLREAVAEDGVSHRRVGSL